MYTSAFHNIRNLSPRSPYLPPSKAPPRYAVFVALGFGQAEIFALKDSTLVCSTHSTQSLSPIDHPLFSSLRMHATLERCVERCFSEAPHVEQLYDTSYPKTNLDAN